MVYSLVGQSTALRSRLIIEGATISSHCDQVSALKKEFGHTIRCVARPANGTCVTHAFDLLDRFLPLVESLQGFNVRPGFCFVEWLLLGGRIDELRQGEVGSLAFYFCEDHWKHVALVKENERFHSKWGRYAVFDHRVSEVPGNYGNVVRFFKKPDPAEAADLFFNFGYSQLGLTREEISNWRSEAGMQPRA